MKNKFTSQQIMVLIGACLFQCSMIGVLINCSGVIFAQIRYELGFTMSKISVYNTMKGLTTAIAATAITAFFFKSNKARFLLINQIATIVSFLLLVVGAEGALWYISAIVCGLSSCVVHVAVPMLLNQWFPENAGTVTGIAMAFSGIGGALCNPLCAKLIHLAGWKWSIVILGVIMLAMTIPGLHLMFRTDAPNPTGKTAATVQRDGAKGIGNIGTVILVTLVLLGGSMGVTFALNISMFAQSIGYSLSVGATLTTMIMMGNVCGKFLYGMLCDKLGVWKATMMALSVAAAALLCYLFAQEQVAVLFAASMLFGCVYALSVVGISRCCISAYGQQESKRYLGIHTCINSIITAAVSLLVGILYDWAQSFTPVIIMVLCAFACSFAAASVLMSRCGKPDEHIRSQG